VDSPLVLVHGNRMGVWVAMGNNGLVILTCVHFGHDNLDLHGKEGKEIQNLDVGVPVAVGRNYQNVEGTYVEGVVENPQAFHWVGQRNDQAVRKDAVGKAFPCDAENLFRL